MEEVTVAMMWFCFFAVPTLVVLAPFAYQEHIRDKKRKKGGKR